MVLIKSFVKIQEHQRDARGLRIDGEDEKWTRGSAVEGWVGRGE